MKVEKKAHAICQNAYKVLRLCASKHGGAACKYICWITAKLVWKRKREKWDIAWPEQTRPKRAWSNRPKTNKSHAPTHKENFHFIWKTNTNTHGARQEGRQECGGNHPCVPVYCFNRKLQKFRRRKCLSQSGSQPTQTNQSWNWKECAKVAKPNGERKSGVKSGRGRWLAGWEGSWIGGCLRCRQESRSKHEINPHRQRELQLRCLQCKPGWREALR